MILNGFMKEDNYTFWISQGMKCIALKETEGYQKMKAETDKELWKRIYDFLELGYRIR